MQIRIDNSQPCEAATALRSHVYNDRNLWLLEASGAHAIRVVLNPSSAEACINVRCGNARILGEVVAQLAERHDVLVLGRREHAPDDTVTVYVPSDADTDVAIALFRALCILARPTVQPGPAPRRRWFFRHS